MIDLPRLRALLGGPELSWLIDRLVRRLEQGRPLTGKLRLARPTPAQQAALARVVGDYGRGEGLVVDLDALGRQLEAGGLADSLEQAVTALRGPVAVRAEDLARVEAAWDAAFAGLQDEAWTELRRSGLVKRLVGSDPAAGARLLADAALILARLPAPGQPLAELAASTGDAHALDAGRPLASVVLRVLRARTGVDPADRRMAWAAVGVELDPLSSSVLVLNLLARGEGLAARLLAACAEAGEPCRLTLRQLRTGLDLEGDAVYACENPAVVLAAADRLGARCRPLVCVEGQPNAAARRVLDAAGPRIRYHGDFDWPGVRIAGEVLARTGGRPWRMGAADYREAPKGLELAGGRVQTPWDPALAEAMEATGRAVHEEAVVGGMLGELGG